MFNFTNIYQFRTRLKIDNETLETVENTKLLGTTITSDLKWDLNTNRIVQRAYAKMELLRKLSGFGAPISDLRNIYVTFVRTQCEQSCCVWHSGLTQENEDDLERVQKVAMKIILKNDYKNHENALNILELQTLKERREELCLSFARKCLRNEKMKALFPPNKKIHTMTSRDSNHFEVFHSNTERKKKVQSFTCKIS